MELDAHPGLPPIRVRLEGKGRQVLPSTASIGCTSHQAQGRSFEQLAAETDNEAV